MIMGLGISNRNRPVYGLTGGIASGKTFVADRLASLGAVLVDTDLLAREIVAPGSDGLNALIAAIGTDFLQADGQLDRRKLRSAVFAQPALRQTLEAITHPRILALAKQRATGSETGRYSGSYVLVIIPLLKDKLRYDFISDVVVVDCQAATQISRLTHRDGISDALAKNMLAAQISRTERLKLADHVIINDDFSGRDRRLNLTSAITELHQKLVSR
jgi:dephospho-CoA kinase